MRSNQTTKPNQTIGITDDSPLIFETCGKERLRIASNGLFVNNNVNDVLVLNDNNELRIRRDLTDSSSTQKITKKKFHTTNNNITFNGRPLTKIASPTFQSVTIKKLTVNSTNQYPIIIDNQNPLADNSISFKNGNINVFNIGIDQNDNTVIKSGQDPISLMTGGIERIRINNTIQLDNAITNIIGIGPDGKTLSVKNDFTTDTASDVLTNKTIRESANTLQVGPTAISNIIDQDVTTQSSPTFNRINITDRSYCELYVSGPNNITVPFGNVPVDIVTSSLVFNSNNFVRVGGPTETKIQYTGLQAKTFKFFFRTSIFVSFGSFGLNIYTALLNNSQFIDQSIAISAGSNPNPAYLTSTGSTFTAFNVLLNPNDIISPTYRTHPSRIVYLSLVCFELSA